MDNKINKLNELNDLFKTGAITKEEFDHLKKEILTGSVENKKPEPIKVKPIEKPDREGGGGGGGAEGDGCRLRREGADGSGGVLAIGERGNSGGVRVLRAELLGEGVGGGNRGEIADQGAVRPVRDAPDRAIKTVRD